jgi:hypothetical protein
MRSGEEIRADAVRLADALSPEHQAWRVISEVPGLLDELDALRAQVERDYEEIEDLRAESFPKSWVGFRAFIDEVYPADLFPGDDTNLGPQFVVAARVFADIRAERDSAVAREVAAKADIRDDLGKAWAEGYAAARYMAKCWGHVAWWEDEPGNPYLTGGSDA